MHWSIIFCLTVERRKVHTQSYSIITYPVVEICDPKIGVGRILLLTSTTSWHEERDTRTDLCTSENIFRGLRPSARHGSPLDKRGRKAAREPPKTMLKCFGSLSQTVERKRVTAQPRDGEDEEAAGGEGEAAVGRTGGTSYCLSLFSPTLRWSLRTVNNTQHIHTTETAKKRATEWPRHHVRTAINHTGSADVFYTCLLTTIAFTCFSTHTVYNEC